MTSILVPHYLQGKSADCMLFLATGILLFNGANTKVGMRVELCNRSGYSAAFPATVCQSSFAATLHISANTTAIRPFTTAIHPFTTAQPQPGCQPQPSTSGPSASTASTFHAGW